VSWLFPPRGTGHRRRAAWWFLAGGSLFAAVTVGVFVLRPRPRAYVPGKEAETSDEITHSLERKLPAPTGAPPAAGREEGAAAGPVGTAPAAAPNAAQTKGPIGPAADVPGGVTFTEQAAAAGLTFVHFSGKRSSQLPEDMGSGLAWGDYDGDGRPDLFVVNESGPLSMSAEEVDRSPAHAHLFHNNGDGTFTDVTEKAGLAVRGLGMGAAWGDYDGDGRLDLFVSRYGTNLLFHNDGNGHFTDMSKRTGIDRYEGFWTGVSWADYDRDGDLDIYVCGYVKYRWDPDSANQTSLQFRSVVPFTLNPSSYPPERNLLLRNDHGVFHEVAHEAGVDNPTGRSLSASWVDFDGDGWPDLYVANDISDNAMFLNLHDGHFRDVTQSAWVADYRGSMGLAIGDWDNSDRLDIFITHWLAQQDALFINETRQMKVTPEAPLRFVDQADVFGLGQISLDVIGWGTGFLDFDNDGRLDLYAINGSTLQEADDASRLTPMRSFLFWNAGEQGYYEIGKKAGPPFATPAVGRGASFADYDGDGDLDIAYVVHGGALRLARNEGGNRKGWLRVMLRAPGNTHAVGARVRLTTGAMTQTRVVGAQSSYLSQEPPGEAFFGVGDASRIDKLEVLWPDGKSQSFADLPSRATFRLREGGRPEVVRDAK
jgi:hypothetical protein